MKLSKSLKDLLRDQYKHSRYSAKQVQWAFHGTSWIYTFRNYDKRITGYDKLCEMGLLVCIGVNFEKVKGYIITEAGEKLGLELLKEFLLTQEGWYIEEALYTYDLTKNFLED